MHPAAVVLTAPTRRTHALPCAAEPLLLDVATTLQRKRRHVDCIVGGRYGLASKDFTPAM